jgi:hypothetical protein
MLWNMAQYHMVCRPLFVSAHPADAYRLPNNVMYSAAMEMYPGLAESRDSE